jgi:hypothetical protein
VLTLAAPLGDPLQNLRPHTDPGFTSTWVDSQSSADFAGVTCRMESRQVTHLDGGRRSFACRPSHETSPAF